ncbi:tetratricopeptide repeat protein [Aestuariivivens sediminis]|uniref:tetratricopeptide repeat protein n=1 Tax=Aestuariivivens sediminis TaxID=2913557 RepID=UPI001F58DC43|nr:tetratricopeptide repeat protein [Aestuariivivens sediminis]
MGQTKLEDSIVTLTLNLSDRALYDARFEEAKNMVNLSYFKNFKDYKIEHGVLLTVQKLRIDGIANNVFNKRTNHRENLNTLLNFLPDSNKIEDTEVLGQLYFALSQAYRSNNIIDSSLIYHDKSLQIFEDHGNFEKIAEIRAYDTSVKHNMLLQRGDKAKILELIPEYEKEIKARKHYSKYILAYNTRHLAQIYRRQLLDYEKALQLFKWSLELRLEIGFKPYLPASYSSLGDVYMKMGEDKLAIAMYTESCELAEEIGFIRFQSYPNLQIGDIYLNTQKPEKAYKYYLKALKLASKNNFSLGIDQSIERIEKLNTTKYKMH